MKNKNKNKEGATSKRELDPIRRPRIGIGRPRLNFDGNTLHGFNFLPNVNTVAFRAVTVIPIDCSATNVAGASPNISIAGAANGLTAATRIYGEYWYNSVQLHWVPHVSPGVADGGSPIYVGYIDNPEVITSLPAASDATLITLVRSLKNCKTFNAWQGFTYSVPLTKRVPKFNVDTTQSYLDAPTVSRSVQGVVVVGYESITAAANVGQLRCQTSIELRNMNIVQIT